MTDAPIHLLMVDDDREDVELVRDVLQNTPRSTIEVEWAATYDDGISALEDSRVDACLVDYRLGARTGVDFLRDAGSRAPLVPLILVTGHGGPELDRMAMDAGATDYLTKGELTGPGLERSVRYAVERARRSRAEARSRALMEHGQGLVSVLRADGSVEWVSPSLSHILGFTPEEKIGRDAMLDVHPEDRDHVQRAFNRLVARPDRTVHLRHRIRHRDGSWRVLDTIGANHLDDPAIRGIVANSWDITKQVEQEDRVRFQAELLEAVGQAVIATDLRGEVIYWNRGAEELYGWSRREAVGRSITDLTVAEADQERAEEILASLREGGVWTGEFQVRRKSGETFHALVTDTPILDREGRLTGIIGATSDISRLKETEAALRERVKELRTLYRATEVLNPQDIPLEDRLGEFVAAIPPGWLYPDITEARLVLDGAVAATTPGFRETPWMQSAPITRGGKVTGRLDVVLTEERREQDEGPFLEEERQLLDTLARNLGDAVERRRADAELRRSEERFREIAEHIQDVFWISTPDGKELEYVSPAYEEVWGRSVEPLYEDAQGWIEAILPSDRERVRRAWAGLAEGHFTEEYRIVRPDGEVRWIFDRAFPVQGEDGGVARIIGIAEDITERKEAEERFGLLSQEISDAIFVVAPDSTVLYSSPSIEGLTGYSRGEFEGMSALDLVHPEDRERVRGQHWELVHRPGATGRTEYRILTRDGSERQVESVSRNRLDHPAIGGIVITSRDVTERVEMEKQLRQGQKLEAVGRMAGGIAHDFNNLLTVIRSQTDLLLMELEEGDALAEEVELIQTSADRAARLTSQLLTFSKDQVLRPRIMDLNQVVQGMGELLERIIGEDVTIVHSPAEKLPTVKVDPAQLEQVIMNLAVNARDAMPDGGTLILSTARDQVVASEGELPAELAPGSYAVLRVADSGRGLDAHTREHMFEPFFTTKEMGKGTGLGLATVYGVVKQSGGEILVESVPGEGSTFSVYFPEVEGEPDPPLSEPRRSFQGHGLTGRVLLVEDDGAVRRVIERILARAGLDVLAVGDAEAAVDELENGAPPDILLTDLVLPGMSGRSLVDRVRADFTGLPVLVMSGYAEGSPGHRGDLPREVGFIRKPFSPEELTRTVEQALTERPPLTGTSP